MCKNQQEVLAETFIPMTKTSFFVALDGDLIGRKLEELIITNKLNELIEYSYLVNKSVADIRSTCDDLGGKTYLQGGDSLLVELPNYKDFIDNFISGQKQRAISFSIGIGKDAVQAYLALKFAKSKGRGSIILIEVKDSNFEFREISQSRD